MKVAIFSDMHDQFQHLETLVQKLKEIKPDHMFCLGDFISPTAIQEIIDVQISVQFVWGNNDGEKSEIMRRVIAADHASIPNATYETLEIGGRKVCLIHRHHIAPSLARSGDFDAVFYGHTHIAHQEMIGNCLLLNPGSVCHFQRKNPVKPSYAIWNTETNTAEIFEL